MRGPLKAATAVALLGAVVLFVAWREDVFVGRTDDDVLFHDMRASLQHVGDSVGLAPLARDASRMCLVPPYVDGAELSERLGAHIPNEKLDFTAWEDQWGVALITSEGVRIARGRRVDGDYSIEGETCWDEPGRLRMTLASIEEGGGFRRRIIAFRE